MCFHFFHSTLLAPHMVGAKTTTQLSPGIPDQTTCPSLSSTIQVSLHDVRSLNNAPTSTFNVPFSPMSSATTTHPHITEARIRRSGAQCRAERGPGGPVTSCGSPAITRPWPSASASPMTSSFQSHSRPRTASERITRRVSIDDEPGP